ncbi:MAG TPA: carboxypeptidase-like regulatory domain-containing protein [Candidatus Acidoferrales bacterium]|nr:carboxypeptidase-like regulatory domain-containing protein [Candidatus Acidoferrales bacterium]
MTEPVSKPLTDSVSMLASKPVANAVVTLETVFGAKVAETKTNADGHYEFPDVQPSQYGVVAKTATACAISSPVNATAGSSTIVRLQMTDRSPCAHALQFAH